MNQQNSRSTNSQQVELTSLLQLANRQVLQDRMAKEAVIKESVRRALLS